MRSFLPTRGRERKRKKERKENVGPGDTFGAAQRRRWMRRAEVGEEGEGGGPKKFMSYSSGLLEPNARRVLLRSTGLRLAPLRQNKEGLG